MPIIKVMKNNISTLYGQWWTVPRDCKRFLKFVQKYMMGYPATKVVEVNFLHKNGNFDLFLQLDLKSNSKSLEQLIINLSQNIGVKTIKVNLFFFFSNE